LWISIWPTPSSLPARLQTRRTASASVQSKACRAACCAGGCPLVLCASCDML
jgi:hypothetical protein